MVQNIKSSSSIQEAVSQEAVKGYELNEVSILTDQETGLSALLVMEEAKADVVVGELRLHRSAQPSHVLKEAQLAALQMSSSSEFGAFTFGGGVMVVLQGTATVSRLQLLWAVARMLESL